MPAPCRVTEGLLSAHADSLTTTPEVEFRSILEYTERQRFKFKLSRWQCRDLIETLCRHDAKLRARRICDQFSITQ